MIRSLEDGELYLLEVASYRFLVQKFHVFSSKNLVFSHYYYKGENVYMKEPLAGKTILNPTNAIVSYVFKSKYVFQ